MQAYIQYRQFTPPDESGPSRRSRSGPPTPIESSVTAGSEEDHTPVTSTSGASSQTTTVIAPENTDAQEKPTSGDYVEFEPDDPCNPRNWSPLYRYWVVGQLTFLTLSLTFASAAGAPAEAGFRAEFDCDEITATAATGLFLVGAGLGALPTAPLSELYGRLPVYVITVLIATLFEIGCALAPNAPALLILRFFAGLVSSAPLSNAGGTLHDIGTPVSRTIQFPVFASAGFLAPILAPVMGGYIVTDARFGWRWMYWVSAIWNALAFLLVFFCMPETLAQATLKLKAVRMRKVTGDPKWRAKMEDNKFLPTLKNTLKRPFQMMAAEPVLQFFIVYLTVAYICLYGSFTAYPLIFADHGLNQRQIGLTFIPIGVGFLSLTLVYALHLIRYKGLVRDAHQGKQRRGIYEGKVEPEERLIPLMAANVLFPIGLLWLAWTSQSHFNVWIPIVSGLPFGIGLLSIFQASMLYIQDAYGQYAASAVSTTTLVRYVVPGFVILAYPQMYQTLGNAWATTLFGIIAAVLTPVPFIFYLYGRKIRDKCTWTVKD